MSDIEDLKVLGDASPQSSWIFVDDYDVETTQNKYYLNCSTEPVTELTDTVEKKELESDSDSISVISESDDGGKDVTAESKEPLEKGPLVTEDENVPKDAIKILYGRLYAFGCILIAIVLPIFLNYIMHCTNSNPPTYLKNYQNLPDEFPDDFLSANVDENRESFYSDSDLQNVNAVATEVSCNHENEKSYLQVRQETELKPNENVHLEINGKLHPAKADKDNYKPESSKESKIKLVKIKTEDYKLKTKGKSQKYSKATKRYKKNNKKQSDDTEKKFFKKEKQPPEFKHEKKEISCGKELSKLRHVIVKQEKQIRQLNKSLKDRERQIKLMQHKIFQEIRELKYLQTENYKNKQNFTHTISGEWYDSYFDHRDKSRKRDHEADWLFDRAHYRQKRRVPDKNWYIDWMLQREDYRKRTGWHFSF